MQIQMIAVAKGTVVGKRGIVHVDPASKRQQNKLPLVDPDIADKLEQRGLARRAVDGIETLSLAAVLGADDDRRGPLEPAVKLGIDAPLVDGTAGPALVTGPAVATQGTLAARTTADAPPANADAIETGLDDDDPDAPPVPKRVGAGGGKK